jgi:hypothetical protein
MYERILAVFHPLAGALERFIASDGCASFTFPLNMLFFRRYDRYFYDEMVAGSIFMLLSFRASPEAYTCSPNLPWMVSTGDRQKPSVLLRVGSSNEP